VKTTAHDCPRIAPPFLEEEQLTLADWLSRQEYLVDEGSNSWR
jgi:hypothetical protein